MINQHESFNTAVAKAEKYASASLIEWSKYAIYWVDVAKISKMYWNPALQVLYTAKRHLSKTTDINAINRIDTLLTCINTLY